MYKKQNNAHLGEMNPKVDIAFKQVFGNPDYPEITKSLLNSVLSLPDGQKIVDVKMKNPNILQRHSDDKYSIMDIRAIANNNIEINIEMQMINKNDMIERSLHYMSRIMAEQLKKGNPYKELHQTICINFLDFDLFPNSQYAHNEFSYRTARGDLLTNLSQIHFIELPKAEKGGIIENEMLRKWVKFINDPSSEEVNMLVGEYTEIKEARKILSLANLKEKIRNMYYAHEDARREKASWEYYKKTCEAKLRKQENDLKKQQEDLRNQQEDLKNQEANIRIQIEKIEKDKKGILECGSHNKAIETARTMLLDGEPTEKIMRYTNLSIEEIQKL